MPVKWQYLIAYKHHLFSKVTYLLAGDAWLPSFGFSELCFSGRGYLKRSSISKTMAQVSGGLFCFSDILWFFNSCNIFIFYPETSYLRKLSLGTYFTFLLICPPFLNWFSQSSVCSVFSQEQWTSDFFFAYS